MKLRRLAAVGMVAASVGACSGLAVAGTERVGVLLVFDVRRHQPGAAVPGRDIVVW